MSFGMSGRFAVDLLFKGSASCQPRIKTRQVTYSEMLDVIKGHIISEEVEQRIL